MTDDDIGTDGRDYRGDNFWRAPPQDVAAILAGTGIELGLNQIDAFSADLDKLRRRYALQKATRAPRADVLRKINKFGDQARRLKASLSDAEVATRLRQELPLESRELLPLESRELIRDLLKGLVALIEAADAQANRIAEALAALNEDLDLGSPDGDLVKGLATLARDHLEITPTMPGERPAGPFVDFVREVYGAWGKPRPTGEAIKANFYRRSGVATVVKTTTQTT